MKKSVSSPSKKNARLLPFSSMLLALCLLFTFTSCEPEEDDTPPPPESVTINGIDLILVKGGTFTMGCTAEQGDDCFEDERPTHQVTLSDYYIGKYEVTQQQWADVMGSNPSYFKDCATWPVENVSWHDAQEFIEKLNVKTGKTFRLPTEAEWEYAARGGNKSEGYKYSGSDSINDVAWYDCSENKTYSVGTKQSNELGIYDMSGNVNEWCSDWHGAYSADAQTNPAGPTDGVYRVYRILRGGSYFGYARNCRVSYRYNTTPSFLHGFIGLRLVLVQ